MTPRPLILILSAQGADFEAKRRACRESWLTPRPVGVWDHDPDYLFAIGGADAKHREGAVVDDVLFLPIPDDYASLPLKTWAACRWILANRPDVSHVFKCDDDTVVHVDRLMDSGFEEHDYVGHVHAPPYAVDNNGILYAHGGAGYWLSRRAMQLVADFGPPTSGGHPDPKHPIEDGTVARILLRSGISPASDPRYRRAKADGWPTPQNQFITGHQATPREMRGWIRLFSPEMKTLIDGATSRPSSSS